MSHARRNFRRLLLVMLAVSFAFSATATHTYLRAQNDQAILLDIAPTLFKINVAAHQTKALFLNDDGKYEIAKTLYRKSIASPIYYKAGVNMIFALAEKGYKPAQSSLNRIEHLALLDISL